MGGVPPTSQGPLMPGMVPPPISQGPPPTSQGPPTGHYSANSGPLNGPTGPRPMYPSQYPTSNGPSIPPTGPPTGPPSGLPSGPPVNGTSKRPNYPTNGPTGPTASGFPAGPPTQNLASRLGNFSLNSGMEPVDLLQNRHILPTKALQPPKIRLQTELWNSMNCNPEIFRCSLTKIPETESILKKCRLPLGILIHPFKDLSHLPVIQCATIVRCRQCRTYINPFVHFVDQRRWRCNVCYRVNECKFINTNF